MVAEAAAGWCGGDDGGERAFPAMRASSLASFDEDGLELDDRCCTISSPAADEPDIAADCARAGSRAPKLLEEGTETARARHFLSSSPHHGARAHEPAGGIYLKTLAVHATGDGEQRRMQRRVCHERAAFRPRRRSNRLLPPPLCCLLTRWSPLLSTARRRRLELTPRGALGGGVELLA